MSEKPAEEEKPAAAAEKEEDSGGAAEAADPAEAPAATEAAADPSDKKDAFLDMSLEEIEAASKKGGGGKGKKKGEGAASSGKAAAAAPAPAPPAPDAILDMSLEEIASAERVYMKTAEGQKQAAYDQRARERSLAAERRAEAQAAMAKRKEERRQAAEKQQEERAAAAETERLQQSRQVRVRIDLGKLRESIATHFKQFGDVEGIDSNPGSGVYAVRFAAAEAAAAATQGKDILEGALEGLSLPVMVVPDLIAAHSLNFPDPFDLIGTSAAQDEINKRVAEVRTFFEAHGESFGGRRWCWSSSLTVGGVMTVVMIIEEKGR